MPQTVSNLSLRMVEEVRIPEADVPRAPYPVWIESRMITGFFPALEMKRLIAEREDLSYIGKVVRNADRNVPGLPDPVPGFSFVREGGESLNEYIKKIDAAQAAAPAGPAPAPAGV